MVGLLIQAAHRQASKNPVSGDREGAQAQGHRDDGYGDRQNGAYEDASARLLIRTLPEELFQTINEQSDAANWMGKPSRVSKYEVQCGPRNQRRCGCVNHLIPDCRAAAIFPPVEGINVLDESCIGEEIPLLAE